MSNYFKVFVGCSIIAIALLFFTIPQFNVTKIWGEGNPKLSAFLLSSKMSGKDTHETESLEKGSGLLSSKRNKPDEIEQRTTTLKMGEISSDIEDTRAFDKKASSKAKPVCNNPALLTVSANQPSGFNSTIGSYRPNQCTSDPEALRRKAENHWNSGISVDRETRVRRPGSSSKVGGEDCATATAIPGIPYVDDGNTCGYIDDYDEVCPYSATAPDVVYVYSPATDMIIDITLCVGTTNYDTKLFVYENDCGLPAIACNEDACSSPSYADYVSRILGLNIYAGSDYYIVVDGYSTSCGDYTIDIQEALVCTPDASVIAPGSWSNSTCGAGNMCILSDSEDLVYEVTIPYAAMWVFSLCGSNFDTYLFLGTTCCGNELESNDDYCGLQSQLGHYLTAGTYYVTIEGNGAASCGDILLDIYSCEVDCPVWAFPENEPCGDDVNGGCNSTPPAFQIINCGNVICGTAWADGSIRDTDWYQVTTTDTTAFIWTVIAEFDVLCGLIESTPPGFGSCDSISGFVNPYDVRTPCDTARVNTGLLPPGIYWFFVAPANTAFLPCTSYYVASLECVVDCVPDSSVAAPCTLYGNTCTESDDCYLQPGSDVTFEVDIPTTGNWRFSLCGSSFDTWLAVGTRCCSNDLGRDDDYCGLQSQLDFFDLEAGTYYATVEGVGIIDCGDYELVIIELPACTVSCPVGAILEPEPCGDASNEGCNSTPPVYTTINCEDTICGTAWALSGRRDTDWYQLALTESTLVHWQVMAEFPLASYILQSIDSCESTITIDFAVADPCENLFLHATLDSGIYWFWVGPSVFYGVPCTSHYVAILNCEEPCRADFILYAPDTLYDNTCGEEDDCSLRVAEDHIYAVEIPYYGHWYFSLCESDPSFDTYLHVGSTCCGSELGENDDFCGLNSQLLVYGLDPGTYYVDVEGYDTDECGDYALAVYPMPPCTVECPPGALLEPEVCGDSTNDGCNLLVPAFTPINCDDTICGTSWSTDSTKDTDWYEFTTIDSIHIIWKVATEFPLATYLIIVHDGCDSFEIFNSAFASPCDTAIIEGDIPAGTYWFWVGVNGFLNIPCSSHYVATLNCEAVCMPDFVVTAPGLWTGTTCGAFDDCSLKTTEDIIYKVTIPYAGTWDFSLCASSYDTWMAVGTSCCGTEIGIDDDGCTGLQSELIEYVYAGDYFVTIEGYSSCGDYVLEVTEIPCSVFCPVSGIDEAEPMCGPDYVDDYNGGCNSTPPVFQSVDCGDIICGKSGNYLSGGSSYRDTDWFVDTLHEPTNVKWEVVADFEVIAFIIHGDSGCVSPFILESDTAFPCDTAIIEMELDSGVYWYWVGPALFAGLSCSSNYVATLSCSNPGGNDCSDPIVVEIPGDLPYNDLSQTTCGKINDYDATCLDGYDGGEDIIYQLNVTSDIVIDIEFDPLGTTWSGICVDDVCPPDDICIASVKNSTTAPRQISGLSLTAGTYYIMIDTWPSPNCIPSFDLTIDFPPDCIPDSVIDAPGTWTGNTCGEVDDCDIDADDSEDFIYEVSIPCDGEWVFSLCGSSYDTKLGVGTDCCLTDVGFNDDYCDFQSELSVGITAGTYYVTVDGYSGACGDYELDIYKLPNTGDDCTTPISISIPADLPYLDAAQTTCCRTDDYDATCLEYYDGGEDIIYELVVASDVDVDITLDPNTTTYTGILIDDECPPGTDCIETSTSVIASPHGFSALHLAAGTYYIMIDTWPSPDCIPDFDLSIDLYIAPDCVPDFIVDAPGIWFDTTCGDLNDCNLRSSEDHIWKIYIPCDGEWHFSLCDTIGDSLTDYDSWMALGTYCCGDDIDTDDDGCGVLSGPSLITATLTADTYWVTIEGYSAIDCGDYLLNVFMTGENCEYPIYVPGIPLNDSGSTCCYSDDYEEACPLASYGTPPDVVYLYSPATDICVDISLCDDYTDFDTKLYVYEDSCNNLFACNDDDCGLQSALYGLNFTAGHDYYIVIDGYSTCGDYNIQITECITSCTPDFIEDAPGVWFYSTCSALNDCDLRSSEDHIWKMYIPCDGEWYFSLCDTIGDSLTNYDSWMALGTYCCGDDIATNDDGCGLLFGPSLIIEYLTADTYWVIIEGFGPADCGDYLLSVSMTGENCEYPIYVPSIPLNDSGNTCCYGDDYEEACPLSSIGTPPDVVYLYSPATD
ncbi:hypothetical protein JXI42_13745, partial [bacterium]|nr:hypothetical protein [bacterium]